MNEITLNSSPNVAMAALLHDLGKIAERGQIPTYYPFALLIIICRGFVKLFRRWQKLNRTNCDTCFA